MKTISAKAIIVLITFLILNIPFIVFAQEDCVLKKQKDGIKVYSCPTVGSEFKTVMAEFELKATIDQYISTVLDVASYKEWHYRSVNPRILKKISDTELIYYTQVSAPWPVSNRDLILRLILDIDPDTKILTATLECIPEYLPVVDNVVRVPKSFSKMTFTPISNSKLKVNYSIHVDPGGQIPAWIANMFSTQGPYETFKNLKDRLEHQQDKPDEPSLPD
jgi:START domain